ncbi:MAG: sulfite exporter TauE/SafE family protein, partial [Candidatus Dormibacter sp.]
MPQIDPLIALAGLVVGFVVGLTGMGGGALMTPILVIIFKVHPLAAIGSDLVASLFMKPVGGFVHWRRGTVEKSIVKWLLVGSVPAAFAGVFVIRWFGSGDVLQSSVQLLLGVALVVACLGIAGKSYLDARRRGGLGQPSDSASVTARPAATVLVGAVVGLIVGMTSVGSGSLMIVLLMLVYPVLTSRRLVGTDLVQAVPLVGAAALGHVLVGDFKLALTLSILIGSIPGVYIGSRLSASAPDVVVRPILVLVLA